MSIQRELFENYFMVSCHIKDRHNMVFVAEEPLEIPDPFELRNFKIIQFLGENPLDQNNWRIAASPKDTRVFFGWIGEPSNHWISATYWGTVISAPEKIERESPDFEVEEDIPPYPGAVRVMVRKAKVVDGKMYMVASGREVRRRDAPDTWTILSNGVPDKFAEKDGSKMGFHDIDGFSGSDLYAAGYNGDVWHWDGHLWKKVPMPTNADIYGVCCGGDGLVYMSTGVETFVVGRENRWEIIRHGDDESLYDVKFRHMVWFKDRVYMGYGSTLYEIKDGKFKQSRLNDLEGRPVDWSCLDANDEFLLAGSKLEVALFDGERFETVIPFEVGGQ